MTIQETLRRAVSNGPASVYAVSQGSGIPWTTMKDFTKGRHTLHGRNLQKLCDYLGYVLVRMPRKRGRKR